ncbi:MAG: hypothetical protein GX754_11840, partial [Clostridiaceae bacterium]|nr:hypothetical protein [Clostridiaceae bacterium]
MIDLNLPNVWGPGRLFAFSGLDGTNSFKDSIAATLTADKIGMIFHTPVKRELSFSLKNVDDIEYEIVASDIIKIQLSVKNYEKKMPLLVVFCQQDVVAGLTSEFAIPVLHCEEPGYVKNENGLIVHSTLHDFTAFKTFKNGENIHFIFSYSNISKELAIEKIEKNINIDINYMVQKKINFFNSLPRVKGLDELTEKTLYNCFSVMKTQVYTPEGQFTTRWTTPERLPHRKLWLWDSVFHSIGNKYISIDLAVDSIKAVFASQREDGFIPHMSAPPMQCSGITQTPILAWGTYKLYEYSGKINILSETYNSLKKYLEWNIKNRDNNKNYLFEWWINKDMPENRCDECGMDNSPRFDNNTEMDCVDFSSFMANEARFMAKTAEKIGLKDDIAYWEDIYLKIKTAINTFLWDEEDKFYYDRKTSDCKFRKIKTVASFSPIFAGVCEKYHLNFLVKHLNDKKTFSTEFPVPSVSVSEPSFELDLWRGPVWINYNYMISHGLKEYGVDWLAEQIISKTIKVLSFWYKHTGTLYEYYDPFNQVPPSSLNRKGKNIGIYDFKVKMQNIRDYGWTCSLYAAMILENNHLWKD